MDKLREQQQHILILKQVAIQPQNQLRPVSTPLRVAVPLPPPPQRHLCNKGSKRQVPAENAKAPHRDRSDSETRARLQNIQQEPYSHIVLALAE